MELIVIHENKGQPADDSGLLRFALSTEPVAAVTLAGLGGSCRFGSRKTVRIALPAQWGVISRRDGSTTIGYEQGEVMCCRKRAEYAKATGLSYQMADLQQVPAGSGCAMY